VQAREHRQTMVLLRTKVLALIGSTTLLKALPRTGLSNGSAMVRPNRVIARSYAFPSNPVPINFSKYGTIPRAHPEQVEKAITDRADFGVYLFDVREAAEWDKEHIAGTINIPLDILPRRVEEPKWDKRKEIYIFGTQAKGYEDAFQAYSALKSAGFKIIYVIESNIKDMVMSGFFYDAEKDIVF